MWSFEGASAPSFQIQANTHRQMLSGGLTGLRLEGDLSPSFQKPVTGGQKMGYLGHIPLPASNAINK
jgi:hypothetical protein